MKSLSVFLLASVLVSSVSAEKLSVEKITGEMKQVADWQIVNPSKHHVLDWTQAPYYLGLLDLYRVSKDAKYLEAVKAIGEANHWGPYKRDTHADDNAVLDAWLGYDEISKTTKGRESSIALFDRIQTACKDKPAAALAGGTFVWSWCDALYMSPPVWAHLSKITKNPRYLAWADKEWWTTTDVLFDPSESLYYRDASFFEKRTEHGNKVFWARGNGWVISGLTRVLDHLPADHPSRSKYLALYKVMIGKLVKLQYPDGLWRSSLLEPDKGTGESSGSAFFVQAIAWGLNRSLLDEKTFRPAMEKGWAALAKNIQPDGRIGFVQRIDAAPFGAGPNDTEVYGSGAFLLAGAEVIRSIDPSKRRTDLVSFKGVKLPAGGYQRAKAEVKVRFVPERSDDFAFENDLVAFRAYGPALRPGPEDSGIDCWLKRVSWPVMDKWYIEDRTRLPYSKKPKPYHEDHGEGLDNYKVGDSSGCGGIGLWNGTTVHKSDTFIAHRIISSTPQKAVFELDYASEMDGKKVLETKRITLALGNRYYTCESKFTVDGKPGAFPVAIGLKPQGGDTEVIKGTNSLSLWETHEGLKLGQTVVLPGKADGFVTETDATGAKEELILTKTAKDGRVIWRAGFAWEGQGQIKTKNDWETYVKRSAAFTR